MCKIVYEGDTIFCSVNLVSAVDALIGLQCRTADIPRNTQFSCYCNGGKCVFHIVFSRSMYQKWVTTNTKGNSCTMLLKLVWVNEGFCIFTAIEVKGRSGR